MDVRVTTSKVDGLSAAMEELSTVCRAAVDRMESEGILEFESSNYMSALCGFHLVLKFAEGFAGASATAKSRDIFYPIQQEIKAVRLASTNERSGVVK